MTVSEAKRWQNSPDPSVRAAARARLAARTARSRRTAPRKAPGREAREAKREEMAKRRREMVAAIEARTLSQGGGCEFCGWQPPAEMHHVLPGKDRRHEEAVETVAWICIECHRQWHRGESIAFERAAMWAAVHKYGKTHHAIEYRMSKAAEARAAQHPTPPAPEREPEETR
jgi:hypothetical protein